MKAIVKLSLAAVVLTGMLASGPAGAQVGVPQLAAAVSFLGQANAESEAPARAPEQRAAATPSSRFAPTAVPGTAPPPANRPPADVRSSSFGAPSGPFAPAPVPAPPREFQPDQNTMNRLPPVVNAAASGPRPGHPAKNQAAHLVLQAERALLRGDLATAQRLAEQAQRLQVPSAAFGPRETRPWQVLLEIQRRRQGVVPAHNVDSLVGPGLADPRFPVVNGLYQPSADATRNAPAQLTQPQPASPPAAVPSPGQRLYQQGLEALQAQERDQALDLFKEAWQFRDELDPVTRQQLKDKLGILGSSNAAVVRPGEPSPLEEVDAAQHLLRQKLYGEISGEQKAAEQMLEKEPFAALERIEKLRERVVQAELEPAAKRQMLSLVDRKIGEFRNYVDQHRHEIEQDERNREILAKIDRERERKFETQNKIAQLVEEYNTLIEERRYAEAEVRAKQVRELDPDSPISRTLLIGSRLGNRVREQMRIDEMHEQGVYGALTSVAESSAPFDDRRPLVFGELEEWEQLSRTRLQQEQLNRRQLSPEEMRIKEALKQKVQVRFTNRPLKEVLETLGSMTDVNIFLDQHELGSEGVTSDTPVTINLPQPISLRSVLNLILAQLRLSYVIQNEVLRVTSEQSRDSNVFHKVYNVADLVIPIPNFVPGYNVGLPSAIREAHRALGYGGVTQPMSMGPLTFAANDLHGGAANASVLAQTNAAHGLLSGRGGTRPEQPMGSSMGGAALADFDTLIELITSTIAPDTWDEVGGPGAIESFPTNLSLVISQTQDVHDQIADLLEQLRRLQDLQVTIEVRFINLRDDFFEQMGLDFDFDIDDNVTQLPRDDAGSSVTIGLDAAGLPTADLDISFTQGNFAASQPAFGGFDATSAASVGFAILSDIEAFFVLQAAQGDERTNILQAPKVTLFNGQAASVADTSQRPFVTSLIPVVGDFAAAHQPVIVVLSEGTSLSVQAVVSSDRRFVRLTLVPFFSQIGEVETFTFTGSTTTNTGSNILDPDGNPTGTADDAVTTTEGTTVQLPTFAFTTVSTTVSVPDGGTVLLGGVKRLREGRAEQGVPMLSKIPYVNRLFKNVGIGRESQSLMLMVTPRIIIQEEEERKLGIELTP